jgi:hypothetical protein
VVFDQKPDSRDEPGSEGEVSDGFRGQHSGSKERLKEEANETTRPEQSAVRPSPRSGEKGNYGRKYFPMQDSELIEQVMMHHKLTRKEAVEILEAFGS